MPTGGKKALPALYMFVHWRRMRGVGDSRIRGTKRSDTVRILVVNFVRRGRRGTYWLCLRRPGWRWLLGRRFGPGGGEGELDVTFWNNVGLL